MIRVDEDQDLDSLLEALKCLEVLGSAPNKTRAEGYASQNKNETSALPQDLLLESLRKTRLRKKPKKQHWKTKLSKRRAKGRRDNRVTRNRRKEEWIAKLSDPTDCKAWYDWLARKSNNGWTQRKGWEISFKDFETYVWPKLHAEDGSLVVPTTRRIDASKPWSLDNVRWYRNNTRELLADGSELYLLKKGYLQNGEAPVPDYSEDEGWIT